MKYVTLGPLKRVRKISDTQPVTGMQTIEVSDETAASLQQQLNDGKIIKWNEETLEFYEQLPPVVVPRAVPAWRVKAITKLTPYGQGSLSDAIDALLNSLQDPVKTIAKAVWYDGNVVERDSPMLLSFSESLGLTKEAVDIIFIEAAKITA